MSGRYAVVQAAVLALLAGIVLAGCGQADSGGLTGLMSDEPAWDGGETAEGRAEMDPDVAFDDEVVVDERGVMPPEPVGAPTGRHVIRSAEVEIEATDTARALEEVVDIARRAGGYAATTDMSTGPDGIMSGWVTLRVPAERLEEVVDDIEAVGDLVPRSRVDEHDVTMEMVDIEARLDNLEAFEQELLALLTEVREADGDAEDLLRVFERIREVRAEIDQLRARQTALRDQVDLATVHVSIQPRRTAGDVAWAPIETLRDAFAATVGALTRVADGVIWTFVTVLPVAVVVLAPLALLWALWRRRVRRGAAHASDPSPTDAPSPQAGS